MATDTESVLDFVTRHYEDLKTKAETDNNTPKNDKIAVVIGRIDELYKTIKKDKVTHDEIVKQLKELKPLYNGLGDLDTGSYTRYIEANNSLNMIVDGFNEVEAEAEEIEGEE
jgi:hypothetical protein